MPALKGVADEAFAPSAPSAVAAQFRRYAGRGIMRIVVTTTILLLALVGSSPANPIILASEDIADSYEEAPENLMAATNWLGLYVNATGSRVEAIRVNIIPHREQSQTVYNLITNPPNAELLFSGVPLVSSGPALTVDRNMDLGPKKQVAEFRLGPRVYTIRLHSNNADLCDSVITLSDGSRTQKLFQRDASSPHACDEPHFRVHWVGDIDRDGRLDMLVTFSPKYSFFPRQLLLSSAARADDIVSVVATYVRFAQ